MPDVIEQLQGYEEQLETLLEPVPPVELRVRPHRKSGVWAALAAAASVLLVIGGVALFSRSGGDGAGIPTLTASDVPSFRMTLSYPSPGDGLSSGTVEVRYEAETGRYAVLVIDHEPGELDGPFGSGPGSFLAYDGETTTVGVAEDDFAFEPEELERTGLGEYAWPTYWEERCPGAEAVATTSLAGRPATEITCGDTIVWVDPKTAVVLGVEGRVDARFDGMFATDVGFEAISVEYSPVYTEDDFQIPLSPGQQDAFEDRQAAEEIATNLPSMRIRTRWDLTGEAAGERGVDSWSEERMFWYQPGAGLRYEVLAKTLDEGYDSPGSYTVQTDTDFSHYEAVSNTWFSRQESGYDYTQLLELGPGRNYLDRNCDRLGDTVHLGREVERYESCAIEGSEQTSTMWIDAATELLIMLDDPWGHYEVVELEMGVEHPANTFVFIPPAGAKELGTDPFAGMTFETGDPVPVVSGSLLDGTPISIPSGGDRPTLLFLFASWCPLDTCTIEVAEQLHKEYGDTFTVIAFASFDEPASVRQLVADLDLTLPVALCDPNCEPNDPGQLWGLQGVPYWLVIDSEGNAAAGFSGNTPIEDITAALAELSS